MLSDLIKLIRGIYGDGEVKLHPFVPFIGDYELFDKIERFDCYGAEVAEFETALSEYTGAKHVIVTCSGTAALYAVLMQYHNKSVGYMPNYTFYATQNAAKKDYMITPGRS